MVVDCRGTSPSKDVTLPANISLQHACAPPVGAVACYVVLTLTAFSLRQRGTGLEILARWISWPPSATLTHLLKRPLSMRLSSRRSRYFLSISVFLTGEVVDGSSYFGLELGEGRGVD